MDKFKSAIGFVLYALFTKRTISTPQWGYNFVWRGWVISEAYGFHSLKRRFVFYRNINAFEKPMIYIDYEAEED